MKLIIEKIVQQKTVKLERRIIVKKFSIIVRGSDVGPISRLLNAMTNCGLLHSGITWEDIGIDLKILIEGPEETKKIFRKNQFLIVELP